MKIIILWLITIMGSSCFTQNRNVSIKNNSDETVDSIIFFINTQKIFKLSSLKPNLDTLINYSSSGIDLNHDVFFAFGIFQNGNLVDSMGTFNDLGYLPTIIKLRIIDSLKLKIDR